MQLPNITETTPFKQELLIMIDFMALVLYPVVSSLDMIGMSNSWSQNLHHYARTIPFILKNQANRIILMTSPYHATYWNSTFQGAESTTTNINSICIFETDIGHPITRHSAGEYKQSTKGSSLVVRVIATVGNYDYLWDYNFFTDGAISVDARASGYLQANYYRPEDKAQWGPRIAETLTGTLHTHVMNFKVDFDIIDTKNTLLKTELVVENITQREIFLLCASSKPICTDIR
jgi:hypothetical protein